MLALSVKTSCGPTSVRIVYSHSCFWLESISPCLFNVRSFPDVLSLIQYYKSAGEKPWDKTTPNNAPPTIIESGAPLKLSYPLHKPNALPSLQHLVCLTINRHTNCPDQLPLPKRLLHYLQDYPFCIWECLSLKHSTQRLGQGYILSKYTKPQCNLVALVWVQCYYSATVVLQNIFNIFVCFSYW